MSYIENNSTAIEQSERALIYRMASAIAEGQVFESLEGFAHIYGLTLDRAVSILASPSFQQVVRQIGQAQATLAFATVGIPALIRIAKSSNDAYAIQAIKTLGEMSGALKSKRDGIIKQTLEQLLAMARAEDRPEAPTVEGQIVDTDIFDIEGL